MKISTHEYCEHGELKSIQLDVTAPEKIVEVQVSSKGDRIWVNVDGICMLRICRIPNLRVDLSNWTAAQSEVSD